MKILAQQMLRLLLLASLSLLYTTHAAAQSDKKAADKKASDKKASDKKAADKKAADKKAADKKASDKKASDKKASDKKDGDGGGDNFLQNLSKEKPKDRKKEKKKGKVEMTDSGLSLTGGLLGQSVKILFSGWADYSLVMLGLERFAEGKTTVSFVNWHVDPVFTATLNNWATFSFELKYENTAQRIRFTYNVLDIFIHHAFNIRVGYYLVPFNFYNENLQPTVLHKLVSHPVLSRELAPDDAWSELGIQIRGWFGLDKGRQHRLHYVLWAGNGLEQTEDKDSAVESTQRHGHLTVSDDLRVKRQAFTHTGGNTVPEGGSLTDMGDNFFDRNHPDKAIGARVHLELFHRWKSRNLPHILIGGSFYTSAYTTDGQQRIFMAGAFVKLNYGDFEFLSEGVYILQTTSRRQLANGDPTDGTLRKFGAYAQAAYLVLNRLEFVLRGEIAQLDQAEKIVSTWPTERDRIRGSFGVNYYILKRFILRVTYDLLYYNEFNTISHDLRFMISWGF